MKSTQTQSIHRAPGPLRGESGPALILVLCCTRPLAVPSRFSLRGADEVLIGRGPDRAIQRIRDAGRAITVIREADSWMSSSHARLQRSEQVWSLVDAGSKNGTFVDGLRVASAVLSDGALVRTGGALWLFRERIDCGASTELDLALEADAIDGFSTLNPKLAAQFASLRRVASTRLSVLLSGPTGTGKEVVAHQIHAASGRPGPFVSVNCGAIPSGLVEATLLGSRKGSFSSATENRAGMVRTSDRGTLFLDEIGELPLSAQTALLRVLQEREVLAVGSDTPNAVDLRVVAATNRDLEKMVEENTFREDLLARLAGHCVELPSLASRREDFGLLCSRLLANIEGVDPRRIAFTPEAANALFAYHWPRNIRELAQALTRAFALADDGIIDVPHLPQKVIAKPRAELHEGTACDASRSRLIDLLHVHGGNLSAIAREMCTSRSQVRRLLERHAIEPHDFRA